MDDLHRREQEYADAIKLAKKQFATTSQPQQSRKRTPATELD